ncbi:uncharacterized protein LOC144716985 [Wolffia australiana]
MMNIRRNRSLLPRTVFVHLRMSSPGFSRSAQALASNEEESVGSSKRECYDASTWKVLDSRVAGINKASISASTWKVLNILRTRGFQAYLVGGCVRDLLLKKTPKDFDVITSASLKEVKGQFHRAIIVGRRFPICQVFITGSIVEVSSFETTRKNSKERQPISSSKMAAVCDNDSLIRWNNCLHRDFTINSLFYDPSSNKIYDYVDGIKDLMSLKVRTVIPAHLSFEEDCARILRGIRIAARLGLTFSRETAQAIRDVSSIVSTLDKSRLMMEMNFLLAYGAAESSVLLLHKFKILEIVLPVHAVYMSRQMTGESSQRGNMLLKLLSFADKLLSADRPCDGSLWLGLLAFHLALLLRPQDTVVVWAFASVLYHGDWGTAAAVNFAKERASAHQFCPELHSSPVDRPDDPSIREKVSGLASLVKSTVRSFVYVDAMKELTSKIAPGTSTKPLVFVSPKMGKTVAEIFNLPEHQAKSSDGPRGIDFIRLKKGNPDEVRFVMGKVIIDAMNSGITATAKEGGLADDLAAPSSLYELFRR